MAAVVLCACGIALSLGAAPAAAAASGAGAPITAERIDAYLVARNSPLAGQGSAFMSSGLLWKVDPRLVVAIAGAESSFGIITCAQNNAWGWGCPNNPYSFPTWAAGIDAVNKGLRENYLADGLVSVAQIHQRYAPIGAANDPTGLNNAWTINVSRILRELGGDPNDIDLAGDGAYPFPLGVAWDSTPSADPEAEVTDERDGAELEIAAGTTQPVAITLRNSGTTAWQSGDVRLRRIDASSDVASAPYAVLDADVAPGADGRFRIDLAPQASTGTTTTQWRLEGPQGSFGAIVSRVVTVTAGAFAANSGTAQRGAGIGDGQDVAVIRFRNAGHETWLRSGDQPVALAIVRGTAGSAQGEGWISPSTPALLLEREVRPGETGSFTFRYRPVGESGTNTVFLLPMRDGSPASGMPVRFSFASAG